MVGVYGIEKPHNLFTLPPTIDSARGRITTSRTHSILGTSKRKRPEIAVGIDGEAINVYNVKQPQLVSSHPIPPQAYLTAPPCSILSRRSSGGGTIRFTYAALRNELGYSSFTLKCYHDTSSKRGQSETSATAEPKTHTFEIGSDNNPVVYVGAYPTSSREQSTTTHDVIVVQKNGQITGMSEDLQTQRWQTREHIQDVAGDSAGTDATVTVEASFLHSAAFVAKKLLQRRPDISSIMEGDQNSSAKTGSVLVLVTNPGAGQDQQNDKHLQLWYLRPRTQGFGQRLSAELLVDWPLPESTARDSNVSQAIQYAFDEGSGQLQVLVENHMLIYGFSEMVPRLLYKMPVALEPNRSFLPIFPMISLVSSKNHCVIYNVQYSSTQATQSFEDFGHGDRLKRKRGQSESHSNATHVELRFFFADLALAVGLCGRELVGVQLAYPTQGKYASSRHKRPRLIDSIGMNYVAGSPIAADESDEKWNETKATLDELASERKDQKYEKVFMDVVDSASALDEGIRISKLQRLALTSLGHILDWNIRSKPIPKRDLGRPSLLKVVFMPSNVFQWLTQENYVVAEKVEKALHIAKPFTGPLGKLTPQEIVKALANHDPSLVTLSRYFTQSRWIALPGVVESFKCLIESFDTPQVVNESRLLTDGDGVAADAQEEDQDVLAEEEAAMRELDIATSFLEEGVAMRAAALRSCLEKLGACYSARALSQALRAQLSRRDLILLIELLRIELGEGGWTSRVLDFYPSEEASTGQKDEAITVITALLSSAIDALGSSGWLAASDASGKEEDAQLIAELRGETAAVLEGVQESTFFAGFLKDFLRFETTLRESSHRRNALHKLDANATVAESLLPFGQESIKKIDTVRVAAGGEIQKRSKRDIGNKISKTVGKYSFETLRV